MKICRKCKIEKPLAEFGNRTRNPDGLQNECRVCKNASDREYLAANPLNPEKVKEYGKKHYAANREKRKEYSRNYRVAYPEKAKESNKKSKAKNPEKVKESERNSRIVRYYGISSKDFEQMQLTQGGACAICKVVPKKRLHIDHDHSSGRVRALLCSSCNLVLGHLKDSPELARAFAAYLEKYNFPATTPGETNNQIESR